MLTTSTMPRQKTPRPTLAVYHTVPLPDEEQRSETSYHLTVPDLRRASIVGLCHLMDALRCGGDGLFAPDRSPCYPALPDNDAAGKLEDGLSRLIYELEHAAAAELRSRPVPANEEDRERRARVLLDYHFRSMDGLALEGLDELIAEI